MPSNEQNPGRCFSRKERYEMLEHQEYMCGGCGRNLWPDGGDAQAHHIVAYRNGGATVLTNGVMLCPDCHKHFDRISWKGQIFPAHPLSAAEGDQIRNSRLFKRANGK